MFDIRQARQCSANFGGGGGGGGGNDDDDDVIVVVTILVQLSSTKMSRYALMLESIDLDRYQDTLPDPNTPYRATLLRT